MANLPIEREPKQQQQHKANNKKKITFSPCVHFYLINGNLSVI